MLALHSLATPPVQVAIDVLTARGPRQLPAHGPPPASSRRADDDVYFALSLDVRVASIGILEEHIEVFDPRGAWSWLPGRS